MAITSKVKEKDLENLKLKLTKEYELRIKDMEKNHLEKLMLTKQEAKRVFDVTLENVKNI